MSCLSDHGIAHYGRADSISTTAAQPAGAYGYSKPCVDGLNEGRTNNN